MSSELRYKRNNWCWYGIQCILFDYTFEIRNSCGVYPPFLLTTITTADPTRHAMMQKPRPTTTIYRTGSVAGHASDTRGNVIRAS